MRISVNGDGTATLHGAPIDIAKKVITDFINEEMAAIYGNSGTIHLLSGDGRVIAVVTSPDLDARLRLAQMEPQGPHS